jgi:penicillin amidase
MGDALGPAGAGVAAGRPGYLLALRWTALDPDSDPVAVGLAVQQARSVDGFFAATRGLVAPMQNMVVADRAGRIGVISPGRVPVRGPDNDLGGRVPAPGWDARYDWAGFIPADQTPRRRDPAVGWIATANQRITEPGYPHHLTHEWALPYRQQRIEQVLESRPRHSLQDLAALQMDQRSLAMARLLPWLKRAGSAHPLAAAAKAQLEGFEADMAADRPAPLIAWAWQRQLARAIFADDAGEALWDKSLAGRTLQDALEGVLARDDASWCDDRGTPAAETCAQQAGLALTRALEELAARHGPDVAAWRWGQAHVARSEHRPFSRVPVLNRLFELRAPVGGDTHTVQAMRVVLRPDKLTGDLYHVDHSASLRAVYDLADRSRSGVVHSTGQSGIVFSPRYRDQVGPWTRGELLPLWPQGAPSATLTVQPAR